MEIQYVLFLDSVHSTKKLKIFMNSLFFILASSFSKQCTYSFDVKEGIPNEFTVKALLNDIICINSSYKYTTMIFRRSHKYETRLFNVIDNKLQEITTFTNSRRVQGYYFGNKASSAEISSQEEQTITIEAFSIPDECRNSTLITNFKSFEFNLNYIFRGNVVPKTPVCIWYLSSKYSLTTNENNPIPNTISMCANKECHDISSNTVSNIVNHEYIKIIPPDESYLNNQYFKFKSQKKMKGKISHTITSEMNPGFLVHDGYGYDKLHEMWNQKIEHRIINHEKQFEENELIRERRHVEPGKHFRQKFYSEDDEDDFHFIILIGLILITLLIVIITLCSIYCCVRRKEVANYNLNQDDYVFGGARGWLRGHAVDEYYHSYNPSQVVYPYAIPPNTTIIGVPNVAPVQIL